MRDAQMSSNLVDRGYRLLEALPPDVGTMPPNSFADLLRNRLGYQVHVVTSDKGEMKYWIRHPGRSRNTPAWEGMSLVASLDATCLGQQERFEFVPRFLKSGYGLHLIENEKYVSEDPVELARSAESEVNAWRKMNILGTAMVFCPANQLESLIRDEIAPIFFGMYPSGQIAVIAYDPIGESAMGALRAAYAYSQGFSQADAAGFSGFKTLANWQRVSPVSLGRTLLGVLNYLWYPQISGFLAGPVGLDLLFVFDPPEVHEPGPFPTSWLAIAKSHAAFGRQARRLGALMSDLAGPAARAAAHARFLHSFTPSAQQQVLLVEHVVKASGALFYDVMDLANFTRGATPESPVDPVFAFEHAVTVDRLFRLTLRAMSIDEISAAKTTVFEIADLYDSLSEAFQNTPHGSTEFFKTLFNPRKAPGIIGPVLRRLPEPFGTELGRLCDDAYAELEKTIVDSVWLPALIESDGIRVRSRDLSRYNKEDVGLFVSNVMRTLRNSHHGYFTRLDQRQTGSSRYLWPVDGNIPDVLTLLPALWFLAYVSEPGLVGWKPLPRQAFD
jgi:hypothetical protein